MSVYIRSYHSMLPDSFEERYISKLRSITGTFGKLSVSKTNPYYPEKSDSKIMRMDVVAAIIVIGELLKNLKLDSDTLENMGLFVANGAFLEEENRNIKRTMKAFQKIRLIEDPIQKLKYVYKCVPPLTALETLTNSTMSFIAKYAGIKGNNATYGNTSYSGFAALVDAIQDVKSGGSSHALVGGANGAGVFSALAHISFYDSYLGWKESENCAFLLLQNNKKEAVAKIVKYKIGTTIPSLFGVNKNRQWADFLEGRESKCFIYSGGFTPDEFELNRKEAGLIGEQIFSWNDDYGSLGAASLVNSLIRGIELIKVGTFQSVDIVDRDPYGRETYLQIANVNYEG